MKNPTIETQKGLEQLYSKHQLLPVLREEFAEMGDTCEGVPAEFVVEALAQIYLHRQADALTMVGILHPKFGEPQEIADHLLTMCMFDFLDYNENLKKFVVKYDISEDVQQMLARYQYPLPMVVKPNPVKCNIDTGYETMQGLVVLNGTSYFMDQDVCLDHINRVNGIALALNMETVYSEEGRYIRPVRQPNEDFDEFRKRLKQSDTFYATSINVMETIDGLSDQIYMTHKYDRRGRVYASGYHISPQGGDYQKATLSFAKKELVCG
jgi:hypothetical protein